MYVPLIANFSRKEYRTPVEPAGGMKAAAAYLAQLQVVLKAHKLPQQHQGIDTIMAD